MRSLSTCRNCPCLHYFSSKEETYPVKCYCITARLSTEECSEYIPKDNLEYLEWVNEKRSKA
jgi:hypothetical protein